MSGKDEIKNDEPSTEEPKAAATEGDDDAEKKPAAEAEPAAKADPAPSDAEAQPAAKADPAPSDAEAEPAAKADTAPSDAKAETQPAAKAEAEPAAKAKSETNNETASDDDGKVEAAPPKKSSEPPPKPKAKQPAKAHSTPPPAKPHKAAHAGHGGHAEAHGDMHYVQIWAILVVLLVASVLGPMLGHPFLTLITAFGIALVKAFMVAKNFMHLNIERRYIVYLLATMVALMGLFFAGVAPDVMKHKGHNWKNDAAEREVHRALEAAKRGEHGH